MTTTQPDPDPQGDTGPPRAWRDTLEKVTEGLLDLISSQPDLSEDVGPLMKQAMRLRGQIEEIEVKQLRDEYLLRQIAPVRSMSRAAAPREPWALMADRPPPRQEQLWYLDVPASRGTPKRYRIDDQNLKELTVSPQGETTLQVSFEDYVRVAAALEHLAKARAVRSGKQAGVSARRIMSQTGRAEASEQIRARQVSLTHVYICSRFWMDVDIIERPVRGQFRPADPDRSFTTVAIETWEQLAAQTD